MHPDFSRVELRRRRHDPAQQNRIKSTLGENISYTSSHVLQNAMSSITTTGLVSRAARNCLSRGRPGNGTFTGLQKRFVSLQTLDANQKGRERIVVLGSGWAGYSIARDLDQKKYQVVVVSPRSYFVFTPLLASTAVGTLEFRTALEPIRSRRSKVEFFQAWADDVDFGKKTLTIEESVADPWQGRSLVNDQQADDQNDQRTKERKVEVKKGELFDVKWDKLVIAVGCYNQTFNTKGKH